MRMRIGLFVAAAAGVVLAGCGGSDGTLDSLLASTTTPAPATTPTPATSAPATSAPVTSAPVTSAPATTSNAALEAQLTKAYTESRTVVPRASIEGLKIGVVDGVATFSVTPGPGSLGPESKFLGGLSSDALAITSQSALVAAKVTFTSTPEVKRVVIHTFHAFALAAGGTRTEIAATIALDRATAAKLDYTALASSVPKDNRPFLCGADAYRLHVVVWTNLADRGCLTSPSKGTL